MALKAPAAPKNQSLTETPADTFTPSSVAQRSGSTIVSGSFDLQCLLRPKTLAEYLAKAGELLLVDTTSFADHFESSTRSIAGLKAMAEKLEEAGLIVRRTMMTKELMKGESNELLIIRQKLGNLLLPTPQDDLNAIRIELKNLADGNYSLPLANDVYSAVARHDLDAAGEIANSYQYSFAANLAIQGKGLSLEKLSKKILDLSGVPLEALDSKHTIFRTEKDIFTS